LLAACGGAPSDYAVKFAGAERAESAGRFAEAAAQFDAAAAAATKPRDKEHAEYLGALMHIKAGDVAGGAKTLAALAAGSGEHASEAALRLAIIHVEENDPNAYPELEAIALRFPESGDGKIALQKILAHSDEANGDAATLAYIQKLSAGPLASTALGETLAYQAAIRLEKTGKLAEAREAYVSVARTWPYPKGRLFDDSLWRASEVDEKLGHFENAVGDLDEMLHVRESSHFTGSYERPRFPPAMIRIGVLYAEKMKDRAKAREAFRRAFDDLPSTNTLKDDAAWHEAQLWEADGNKDEMCGRLRALVSAAPDSRYVPCATTKCTDIKRPDESKAPKTCHAYLARP
jgi:tetratricopeptide (TPR) repeat protein